MPMTIVEKILTRAAGCDHVKPGDYIMARADSIILCDLAWFLAGPAIEELGVPVVESERVAMTVAASAVTGVLTDPRQLLGGN